MCIGCVCLGGVCVYVCVLCMWVSECVWECMGGCVCVSGVVSVSVSVSVSERESGSM